MPRSVASTVLALLLAACTSIGPATVPQDRIDYGTSIANSWKEQAFLNIVKLRYADMPIFLEVAQVIAGYQLQSAMSCSLPRELHGEPDRPVDGDRRCDGS